MKDLIALIYPQLCSSCQKNLYFSRGILCSTCLFHLPKTNFHLEKENPLTKIFWGKVRIEHASSFCFFNKSPSVRNLIHQLKYSGQKEIGYEMGKLYGWELLHSEFIREVDIIVPIPLHVHRKRRRGYNQSDYFAQGLSSVLSKEWSSDFLERIIDSASQTKKTKYTRWKNVENIFRVKPSLNLKNLHVLLVDDVITTGSTMEAAAIEIKSNDTIKISIATLACVL